MLIKKELSTKHYSLIRGYFEIRPRGYKTFFKLNSTVHEICPAHRC